MSWLKLGVILIACEMSFFLILKRREDRVVTFWYRMLCLVTFPGIWPWMILYLTHPARAVGDEVFHTFHYSSLAFLGIAGQLTGGILGIVGFGIHETLGEIFRNARIHAGGFGDYGAVQSIMRVWWMQFRGWLLVSALVGAALGALALVPVRYLSHWQAVWASSLNLHLAGAACGAAGSVLAITFVWEYTKLVLRAGDMS